MSDSTHTAANAATTSVTYGYFYGEADEPRTFVNLSWENPLYACDDFIATSYPGHLDYDVAVERAVAEFNAPKCSCLLDDAGDGENGPRLDVDRDALCPLHGRKAAPGYWSDVDRADGYGTEWYLINALVAAEDAARLLDEQAAEQAAECAAERRNEEALYGPTAAMLDDYAREAEAGAIQGVGSGRVLAPPSWAAEEEGR